MIPTRLSVRRAYRTQETKRGVRQYTCVAMDEEKIKLLESRKKEVGASWQRAVSGEIFSVPVISKLVSTPARRKKKKKIEVQAFFSFLQLP